MKRSRNQHKPPAPYNLIVEEIVGLTTINGNGLASNCMSSKFAYIAGCAVVLHDVKLGIQSYLMASKRVPNPLNCVVLSRDTNIVAAGESGHHPGVLIWDCANLTFICELKGHQYGVACMAMSSDGKYLVSVGFPRDGRICIWDWQNKILTGKVNVSSVSSPITSIDFSLDNKFIVTAEKNQLRFWKVKWALGSRANARSLSVTMQRTVDLGRNKDSSFVAVASLSWMDSSSVNHIQAGQQMPFYAVTEKGTLCMVYPGSSVTNSVELEVVKCFALSTSTNLVACACNDGIVKLFGTKSLQYVGCLLYYGASKCKESTVLDYKSDFNQVELKSVPTPPDAIACQFSTTEKLVVVYDDHSLYVWNVQNVSKATRCCVLVSHGGYIWDLKNVPCEHMHHHSLCCAAKGCSGGLSFATCSVDGNIKLWDLALKSELSENCLSSNGDQRFASAGIFERDSIASISSPGFCSMAVSSDGKHLAAGDFHGSIHIFDLHTSDYTCIKDAHGGKILSLSFNSAGKNDLVPTEALESHVFLASGGQDGRIHLFDVERNFNLFGTIEYHSSAITAIKVTRNGRHILSYGADRSLVLHSVDESSKEFKFSCLKKVATSGTICDVAIDHSVDIAYTVGKDKKIRVFDILSGKLVKLFKHDGDADAGDPIKATTDGNCTYLACSYSNRRICIYDCITGKVVAQATGHSEVITGMIFLPDCKHLVSVGADGCIFVWRLPASMTSRLLHKIKEVSLHFPLETKSPPVTSTETNSYVLSDQQRKHYSEEVSINGNLKQNHEDMILLASNSPGKAGFKFSISRLPKWARCKVINNSLLADIGFGLSKDGLQENYECLESNSPSKGTKKDTQHFSGTSSRNLQLTESSRVSPSSSESYSWALGNRWLTVHTVCMDLLDSPKTDVMESLNVQGGSATENRSQCQGMETTHRNKRIKLASKCPLSSSSADPNSERQSELCIGSTTIFPCTDEDLDASRKKCLENENSIVDTGNSSAMKDENKSSMESSSISQNLEWNELLKGSSRFLSTLHPVDASLRNTERSISSCSPMKPSTSLSTEEYLQKDAAADELPNPLKQHDRVGEVEICGKALQNLEVAAENALQAFYKLATVDAGENRSGGCSKADLYGKAAKILPHVEEKIQSIAKLLQQFTD